MRMRTVMLKSMPNVALQHTQDTEESCRVDHIAEGQNRICAQDCGDRRAALLDGDRHVRQCPVAKFCQAMTAN
jgi:hypothetical protein